MSEVWPAMGQAVLCVIHYSKKVLFFDEALYHWWMNPDSIGHRYTEDRVVIDLDIYRELNKIGRS